MAQGARISVKARLQPPPPMALPGGHDFARDAWFAGRGGVGRAIGPVDAGRARDRRRARRAARPARRACPRVAARIERADRGRARDRRPGRGQRGRRRGDAPLGPDPSAVGQRAAHRRGGRRGDAAVAAPARAERAARACASTSCSSPPGSARSPGSATPCSPGCRCRRCAPASPPCSCSAGSRSGARRSACGWSRSARLLVLLFRPEALAGASFQLSFAAVTAIIVLHQSRWARDLLGAREEGWPQRLLRGLLGLFLTGLAVEARADPVRALPFPQGRALRRRRQPRRHPADHLRRHAARSAGAAARQRRARRAAVGRDRLVDRPACSASRTASPSAKGAVAMLPTMPRWAFAAMVVGRAVAVPVDAAGCGAGRSIPLAIGAAGAAAAPVPDLLVTGDGEHLAIVRADGVPVLLRAKSGDFVRGMMSEAAGVRRRPARARGTAVRALHPRRLRRRRHPRRPRAGACSPSAAATASTGARSPRACRRRRHRRRQPPPAARLHPALAQARPRGAGAKRRRRALSRRRAAAVDSVAAPARPASVASGARLPLRRRSTRQARCRRDR